MVTFLSSFAWMVEFEVGEDKPNSYETIAICCLTSFSMMVFLKRQELAANNVRFRHNPATPTTRLHLGYPCIN